MLHITQFCSLLGGIYPAQEVTRYLLDSRKLSVILASPEFWLEDFEDWRMIFDTPDGGIE